MGRYKQIEEIVELMNNPEVIRNVSIIAHVDHGKTTLAMYLLRAAGMHVNPDSDPLELKMTVFPSNVSLAHVFRGQEYLIHIVDTPGHIDFNPAVTRSLRAVDGALVVVDAAEGLMTQTITVLKQAQHEKVKPILFINKIDRLIKEKKLAANDMQNQLGRMVRDVNSLIEKYAPAEHKKDWQVRVEDGRVAFGSAKDAWGLNLAYKEAKGVTFKEIIEAYSGEKEETQNKVAILSKKAPMHELVLNMIVEHLPNPLQAQPYRQSQIWLGDPKSATGLAMAKADPTGPLLMCITTIEEDEHRGLVAIGRVFSGIIETGKTVQLVTGHKKGTIQQGYLVMCDDKLPIDRIPAGNIAALSGLPSTYVGETIAEHGVATHPFEALQFVSEPVVTVAIKPVDVKDLPLFDKVMHKLTTEDPSLRFVIDKESGEYLLSGMGELHLEVAVKLMQRRGLNVKIGKPIVNYRETIGHDYSGTPIMGKSPNKHSKLWVTIEKLSDEVIEAIKSGKLNEMQTQDERVKMLRGFGWSTEDGRNVVAIEDSNILVSRIKGRQYVNEVMNHISARAN